MELARIRRLAATDNYREALAGVDTLLARSAECPSLWSLRGALILLQESGDAPPVAEAERSYLRALELAPDNLEALEGLAHFYDVVQPRPEQAKKFARDYLDTARPIIDAMERIIAN